MVLTLSMQFNLIFFSLLAGFITGVLFDFYRVIRGYNVNKFLVVIEDILFWCLCAIIVFTFLLYTNYALLGAYVYILMFIGIILYFLVLSPKLYNAERKSVSVMNRVLRISFKNISYLFKIIKCKFFMNSKEDKKKSWIKFF